MSYRWCEYSGCNRLARVLVSDPDGDEAYVCQPHWDHLFQASQGGIRGLQLVRSDTN